MPDALLLPAHGPITRSVHTRVDELLAHHEQRLDAVIEHVRAGASTAYDVANAMPWTRKAHQLADLDTEHATLAVLEIATHLDLLAERHHLTHDERNGMGHYTIN